MRRAAILAAALACLISSAGAQQADPPPVLTDDQVRDNLRQALIDADFKERPVRTILDSLATLARVNIVPAPRGLKGIEKPVTIESAGLSVAEALDKLAAAAELRYIVRDGIVVVSDAETLKSLAKPRRVFIVETPSKEDLAIHKRLGETIVNVELVGEHWREAMNLLQGLAKAQMVHDRAVVKDPDAKVTLKLTSVSVATAARLLAEQLGCTYVIWNKVVFITDGATIDRMVDTYAAGKIGEKRAAAEWESAATPADRKLKQQILEKTVSAEFAGAPAREAFATIAKLGGIRVVLDVPENRAATPLTLQLKDTPLQMALDTATAQAGLKWTIRDGAVHVTE